MFGREIILISTLAVMIGCQPTVPKGKTLVPAPEVTGLFRHVCLSDAPEKRLVFPFVELGNDTYRHSNFDLQFSISGKSCSMVAMLEEPNGKLSDPRVEASRASKIRILNQLRAMKPGIKTNIREDGYVTATTELN